MGGYVRLPGALGAGCALTIVLYLAMTWAGPKVGLKL